MIILQIRVWLATVLAQLADWIDPFDVEGDWYDYTGPGNFIENPNFEVSKEGWHEH